MIDVGPVVPELERVCRAYQAEQRIPGLAAGVVVDDSLAWSTGLGRADLERGRPVDGTTLFRIASISKTFTATAIVRLRDRGLLRLDDPAVVFVPELAQATSPHGPIEDVTIRRLLQHTSGLATEAAMPDGERVYPWAEEAVDAALARPERIRLVEAPGAAWRYSNLGYGLLAVIAERVAGRPFDDLVRAGITEPLGMHATVTEPTGELAERCATGYDIAHGDDPRVPAEPYRSRWALGNGGLWSSVDDLARWASAQLGAHADPPRPTPVLSTASLREMHRQTAVTGADLAGAIGLGWRATRVGDRVTVGHTGGLPGFVTGLHMALGEGVSVITLFNTWIVRGRPSLATLLFDAVLPVVREARQAAGADAGAGPGTVPGPDAEAAGRTGTFTDPAMGGEWRVVWHRGALRLLDDAAGDPDRAPGLVATGDRDRYLLEDADGRPLAGVRFLRDASGRVDCLTVDGMPHPRAGDGADGRPTGL